MFGKMIIDSFFVCGVDILNVKMIDEYFIIFVFVKFDSRGERFFLFLRKYGVDVYLRVEDIDMNIVKLVDIFYFGLFLMIYE